MSDRYEPPAPEVAAERTRLRDYFAARALQGLLSNPHYECGKETSAQDAYRHADAMLKARKVQQEAKDWKCFCDENGLGVPGVTCGDCPRDYKFVECMCGLCKLKERP